MVLRIHRSRGLIGQSVLEYAILLSVLGIVFFTMLIYMKNSMNAKFRIVQDRVNTATQD